MWVGGCASYHTWAKQIHNSQAIRKRMCKRLQRKVKYCKGKYCTLVCFAFPAAPRFRIAQRSQGRKFALDYANLLREDLRIVCSGLGGFLKKKLSTTIRNIFPTRGATSAQPPPPAHPPRPTPPPLVGGGGGVEARPTHCGVGTATVTVHTTTRYSRILE